MNSILRFFVGYLVIGTIGTAVILIGVPFLRTSYEQLSGELTQVKKYSSKDTPANGTPPAANYPIPPLSNDTASHQARATEQRNNLLARQAELTAEIDRIKRKLSATPRAQNPYAQEYASAKAAHSRYWKKVRELQKKRDSAADADHVRYSDELRKMKGEDIRLGLALEAAKKQYVAWNADHTKISSNVELHALESELENIKRQLHAIETGYPLTVHGSPFTVKEKENHEP